MSKQSNQTNTRRGSNILTIMKKELRRFFGDRRMVAAVILPGVLIYVIYYLMGDGLMSALMGEEETPSLTIQVEHMPPSVDAMLDAATATGELEISYVTNADPTTAIKEGELDLWAVFPENFDTLIQTYDPASGQPAPEVKLYYNSVETTSTEAYSVMVSLLDAYESTLANRMDINRDPSVTYDLAAPEDLTGMLFSMLMPMLLIMLLFSGCMAMTTESIAGEKERGTIATLLVTPMRRSDLAIGKIAALSLVSLLSGLCSFTGVLLALPKLMGAESMDMMDVSIYGAVDYAMILAVILATTLLFVSVIAVLSALAGSVKEATGFITPLMLLVTLIGVTGMFGGGSSPIWAFCIPVYNSVQCISGVFLLDYKPLQIILTVVTNMIAAGGCVFLLTRMFHSEKLMFKK